MISYRDLSAGLKSLELKSHLPVLLHVSDEFCAQIKGESETFLGALFSVVDTVMMPSFTYRCMVIPEEGPANNGIQYGSGHESNLLADIFDSKLPADPSMGITSDVLRLLPGSVRSSHPLISFCGLGVDAALMAQTIQDPYAPLKFLENLDGSVLLAGVGQDENFSLHYAEILAGRSGFIRWALTHNGIVSCPKMPGDSTGFSQAAELLKPICNQVRFENFSVESYPLKQMLTLVRDQIRKDPQFLLYHEQN
jgi:aminoglycoside 3-N-acetyltransferase